MKKFKYPLFTVKYSKLAQLIWLNYPIPLIHQNSYYTYTYKFKTFMNNGYFSTNINMRFNLYTEVYIFKRIFIIQKPIYFLNIYSNIFNNSYYSTPKLIFDIQKRKSYL